MTDPAVHLRPERTFSAGEPGQLPRHPEYVDERLAVFIPRSKGGHAGLRRSLDHALLQGLDRIGITDRRGIG